MGHYFSVSARRKPLETRDPPVSSFRFSDFSAPRAQFTFSTHGIVQRIQKLDAVKLALSQYFFVSARRKPPSAFRLSLATAQMRSTVPCVEKVNCARGAEKVNRGKHLHEISDLSWLARRALQESRNSCMKISSHIQYAISSYPFR